MNAISHLAADPGMTGHNPRDRSDTHACPHGNRLDTARPRSFHSHLLKDSSLPRRRVPHIWPGFGHMWELTNAGARVPVSSHIWPKEGQSFLSLHTFPTC